MEENLLNQYQKIGLRIREIRIQKGMSQGDLAEKANVSLPQISPIELGKCKMMLSTFVRIIEALQVSADDILRPNVPTVNSIYASEFSELLADCTPDEIDSIIKIVKEVKASLHANNSNNDNN